MAHLGVATPHLGVVEHYLASLDITTTLNKRNIESAYSNILVLDNQGHLALATDEIATYIMPARTDGEVARTLSPSGRKGQLKAIQHILKDTFTSETLEHHGFDEKFFNSKRKLLDINRFTIDIDIAMANLVIRLIVCLSHNQKLSMQHGKQQRDAIAELTREALPTIVLQHNLNTLDEHVKTSLGVSLATLFFADDLLGMFLPVEVLSQMQNAWGSKLRFFDVVLRSMKHPGVIEHMKREIQEHTWSANLQDVSTANELTATVSQMIAKRWLQSNSFWTYKEIRDMFHWFTDMPEVELEEKNVVTSGYDAQRTVGWFTVPNWEKIVAWAVENIHITDQADLQIQTAAVLCAFGNSNGKAKELISDHRNTDWRATFWFAEATSWHNMEKAYDIVEHCLDLIAEQKPHQNIVRKAIDCILDFMGYWENISKDRKIRMKMIDLDREIPGILSHEMIAFTIEVEIRVKRDAGFEFFRSLYESRKKFIIDTFIHRGSTNHFMHIALGRSLAKDTDNVRVLELHDAYKNAMAQCRIDKTLSVQQMYITRLRLGFWYGRLHILRCEKSELDTAIEIWEDLLKDFFRNPSVADVEIVLPIATHLCSVYIRKALQSTASIETAGIIAKVTDMYETSVFSQDPLTLKLRFRLGLSPCVLRDYIWFAITPQKLEMCCVNMLSQHSP